MVCGRTCEVYSRVCGYHRPITNWNKGKREEFKDRTEYTEEKSRKTTVNLEKQTGIFI